MDKPLSDIKKDDDSGKNDVVSTASPVVSSAVPNSSSIKTTVSSYNPELSQKNWKESSENLRWDSSPQGRAAIRLFSRGGLGAAAFAAGSWYAGRGNGMAGYSSALKFSELNKSKPLHYIAKSIDTVIGKPIVATAKMFGKDDLAAENLVRFRPTNMILKNEKGRSLGHEAVSITFDFFSASVGDAMGRDIANLLDSHVKHDWKDKQGHIKYPEAAKAAAKTAWRYVSYNGGEDWAVAVPYAYFMRGQRKLINSTKFGKGYAIDADRGLNGGSDKVNEAGNKVIGNYNLAGMLDLQGRFTAYNIGTLMYREAYNHIDDKLHGKNNKLYGSVSDKNNDKHGILHNIGDLFKWGARSAVKGVIYMTPSVPFFSVFRVSQSKYKGLFINPNDESALGYQSGNKYDALHANELRRSAKSFSFKDGELPDVRFRKINEANNKFESIGGSIANHPLSEGSYDGYKQGTGNPILNKIGQGQNKARGFLNDLPEKIGVSSPSKRSMDTYVNAAFAYTPYMYAKSEAARLWDNGRMDAASERMIDGAVGLNYREFKAGASEVWKSILDRPFADRKREEYALKRIREDSSPADSLTKEQGRIDVKQDISRSPFSWQDRIVSGKPPEKFAEKPKDDKQLNYAEQEAMRKALQELQPPTNSIH
jgi:hypothetical protein